MADRELGRTGEAVAARYYQKQGFCLLEHGFRTRMGELDLVVFKDDLLVIAEVKTRSSEAFSAPCEAVDLRKQQKILLATQQYLRSIPFWLSVPSALTWWRWSRSPAAGGCTASQTRSMLHCKVLCALCGRFSDNVEFTAVRRHSFFDSAALPPPFFIV